jgi:hypothetical protein
MDQPATLCDKVYQDLLAAAGVKPGAGFLYLAWVAALAAYSHCR